jgi:hypothetical protein
MQEKSQSVKTRAAGLLAAAPWLVAGTALAQSEIGDSSAAQPLFTLPSPLGHTVPVAVRYSDLHIAKSLDVRVGKLLT